MGADAQAIKGGQSRGARLTRARFVRQGVMFQHQFGQPFVQNMGVDFCRGHIRMAQQRLDRPQISAIGQQMCL